MVKKVRNSSIYLNSFVRRGDKFRIGVFSSGLDQNLLQEIGFLLPLQPGQSVTPSPLLGKFCDFNANGKKGLPKRNLPKEKFLVEYASTITDWHGNLHYVTICQTRERYQRDHISAPGCEFTLLLNTSGSMQIVSQEMTFGVDPQKEAHVINLFLEAFGDFSVFDTAANSIISAPVQRVNWKLLPPGTWANIKPSLLPVIQRTKSNYQPILEARLEYLNSHNPDKVAVGLGGFSDYLAFEFLSKGICILESIRPLNATYVFRNNWRGLSQLTKTQIINQNLASSRLLHTQRWKTQIANLL